MGSDFCTCLNNLTGGESEDLSMQGKGNDNIKKEKLKPEKKVILRKQGTFDSADPLQSQKENSISTNLNSDYKNTMLNHQQRQLKKNLQSKKNNNDIINKDNKNNIIEINNEENNNSDNEEMINNNIINIDNNKIIIIIIKMILIKAKK